MSVLLISLGLFIIFLNLQKRNQGLNLSQMSHIASKTTNKDALLFMKNIRIGIKTGPNL